MFKILVINYIQNSWEKSAENISNNKPNKFTSRKFIKLKHKILGNYYHYYYIKFTVK